MKRSTRRQALPHLALMLVLVLTVWACGSGGDSGGDTAPDDTTDQSDSGDAAEEDEGNALGAPIGPGREGAVASPIRVPAVPQQGASPQEIREFVKEFVEPEVRKACGGNLCIGFRFVDRNGERATDEECRYVGANPGGTGEHEVTRGSVVRFVFNCPSSSVDTSAPDGGGDGNTPDTTDAPDGSGDSQGGE